mmetsp:Transcript_98939/g.285539  ORF Transcript_98939/g.285539 Transcript_98939/m.285539 type:complete len:84 (-) Transcript_98939:148-399(-)
MVHVWGADIHRGERRAMFHEMVSIETHRLHVKKAITLAMSVSVLPLTYAAMCAAMGSSWPAETHGRKNPTAQRKRRWTDEWHL